MTVFVDTNVLLDVLAKREPFYAAASRLWSLCEGEELQGVISAIGFNNIYYIVRKAHGRGKARQAVRLLRSVFAVAAADERIIGQSIDSEMKDFEDAVQCHSATRIRASCVISRNPDDFPTTGVPVLTPEEFLSGLEQLPCQPSTS